MIGARVLVRPSDHHDWTAEHVYGYAAPDPAAPKDTIIRVHEGIDRLEDHGFVAQVLSRYGYDCQQRECTVGTWVGATVGRGGGRYDNARRAFCPISTE